MVFDRSGMTDPTQIAEMNEDLDLSIADEEGFEKLDDYDSEDDPSQSLFTTSQQPAPKI